MDLYLIATAFVLQAKTVALLRMPGETSITLTLDATSNHSATLPAQTIAMTAAWQAITTSVCTTPVVPVGATQRSTLERALATTFTTDSSDGACAMTLVCSGHSCW